MKKLKDYQCNDEVAIIILKINYNHRNIYKDRSSSNNMKENS